MDSSSSKINDSDYQQRDNITPQLDQSTPPVENVSEADITQTNIDALNESRIPSLRKPKAKVIFNISGTKYNVVRDIGKNMLNWQLSSDPEKEFDIAWTDCALANASFAKLKPFQKINFFPGVQCIARKDQLARNLGWLQRKFPKEYDFFPETFILPAEYYEFKKQFTKDKTEKAFIIKPQAGCQGKGIYLTTSWTNVLKTESYVAQKYLSAPFLLEGLKFDMRIYVLLVNCDPLRIYIHKDGLARFATEPYQTPDKENLEDMCMHLTNYAINKGSPNFLFNESATNDSIGHKRSIKALFKALEEKGHNTDQLWGEIKKVIVKTFCSVQPILAHNYKCRRLENSPDSMCFQIFGFDVILDDKLKPWLLEVNSSPSFTTDTPLDKTIKENVIGDALKLMNILGEDRLNHKKKTRAEIERRSVTGKSTKPSLEEREREYARIEKKVNEWEAVNHGGYEKIFPLEEPKQNEEYNLFIQEAKACWFSLAGLGTNKGSKFSDFWQNSKPPMNSASKPKVKRPQTSSPAPPPMIFDFRMKETTLEENKHSAPEKSEIIDQNRKSSTQCVPDSQNFRKEPLNGVEDTETINLQELEKFLVGIKHNINKYLPYEESLKKEKTKSSSSFRKESKSNNSSGAGTKKIYINLYQKPNDVKQTEDENHSKSVIPYKNGVQKREIVPEDETLQDAYNSKTEVFSQENYSKAYHKIADRKKEHRDVILSIPANPSNPIHIETPTPQKMALNQGKDEDPKSHLPKRFLQHFYKPDRVTYYTTRASSKSREKYISSELPKEAFHPSSKGQKKPRVVKSSKSYESLPGRGTNYQSARPKLGNFIMPKIFESLNGHSVKADKSFGRDSNRVTWNAAEISGIRSLNRTLGPSAYMTNPK